MARSSVLLETREALGFLGVERSFDAGWQVRWELNAHALASSRGRIAPRWERPRAR